MFTPEGFIPMTREERNEAKRIFEEKNFDPTKYQVVRREFTVHRFDPAMTVKGNSITFNNACIGKLESTVYIQFLINPEDAKLAIRPCHEDDRDAIRWCVAKDDKRKSREISCEKFAGRLYKLMGWDTMYRYKLQGSKIDYKGEPLYLFDLTGWEAYLPQPKNLDPEEKKKRSKPMLPAEWENSFGLSVEAHAASTQIDLEESFMDIGKGVNENE